MKPSSHATTSLSVSTSFHCSFKSVKVQVYLLQAQEDYKQEKREERKKKVLYTYLQGGQW
jgi:hypothetical protein